MGLADFGLSLVRENIAAPRVLMFARDGMRYQLVRMTPAGPQEWVWYVQPAMGKDPTLPAKPSGLDTGALLMPLQAAALRGEYVADVWTREKWAFTWSGSLQLRPGGASAPGQSVGGDVSTVDSAEVAQLVAGVQAARAGQVAQAEAGVPVGVVAVVAAVLGLLLVKG